MKIKIFFLSVFLNGSKYKIYMNKTSQLVDILEFFNHERQLIIIEQNGKIQNKLNNKPQYFKDKDKIEIITIVGGG
uniref:Thiamine biosynthesis protein ThiS n=1 Tax=Chorda asiatica TaxID=1281577 RepID=A0A8F0JZ63_9PHAE|nr:hypothetical protein V2475_pgp006 [Chorda asiatica]QWK43185.1 hypothetical protein [Chorda asiatica]WAM62273.1 hypothetical protein [Chorda asiatica]